MLGPLVASLPQRRNNAPLPNRAHPHAVGGAGGCRVIHISVVANLLTAIMRHMARLCMSGERARAGDPTGWVGVKATRCATRLELSCLGGGSSGHTAPELTGRPSATVRNNVASGQLVGSWTRMPATCSITLKGRSGVELAAGTIRGAIRQPSRHSFQDDNLQFGATT
jgi:hypothetical protein